jgi:hypothetical protein
MRMMRRGGGLGCLDLDGWSASILGSGSAVDEA